MDLHVNESVVKGHLHLIPFLTLPDPKDRHVLAAAIHCRANLIVTKNLKDRLSAHLAGIFCELRFVLFRSDFKAGVEAFSRVFQEFVMESS